MLEDLETDRPGPFCILDLTNNLNYCSNRRETGMYLQCFISLMDANMNSAFDLTKCPTELVVLYIHQGLRFVFENIYIHMVEYQACIVITTTVKPPGTAHPSADFPRSSAPDSLASRRTAYTTMKSSSPRSRHPRCRTGGECQYEVEPIYLEGGSESEFYVD